MRVLIYIWLCFCIFLSLSSHAENDFRYSERIESFKVNDQRVTFMRRVSYNKSFAIEDIQVVRKNMPKVQFSFLHGVTTHKGLHVRYSKFLTGEHLKNAKTLSDASHFRLNSRFKLGAAAIFHIKKPSISAQIEAQARMADFQVQAGEAAQRWAQVHGLQLQAQNQVIGNLRQGLTKYSVLKKQNFVKSMLYTFQGYQESIDLLVQLNVLELISQVQRGTSRIKSINYSEQRQEELVRELPKLLTMSPERAGVLLADLFSPLNASTKDSVKHQLQTRGVVNGVLPGMMVGRKRVFFANPQFEDRRLRIQNQLQALSYRYPKFMKGKGLLGARTVQLWLHTAQKAEALGDFELAKRGLQLSQRILDEDPVTWSTGRLGEALEAYNEVSGYKGEVEFQTQDSDFVTLAHPVGTFLTHHRSANNSGHKAVAALGLDMLMRADLAWSRGDVQESKAFLDMAVSAIDLISGFLPAVSLLKDSYEALSGRHWLSGDKLSDLDRSLAIAGVLTIGFSSAGIKTYKALKALLKKHRVTDSLIQQGTRLYKALRRVGTRTQDTYQRVRKTLRGSSNFDEAEDAILNVGKDLRERIKSLGFQYKFRGLLSNNYLNNRALKGGRYAYHKPNSWAYAIETKTHPTDLVRVSGDKNTVGAFFFHKNLLNHLVKRARNADELAFLLKSELNIEHLPMQVSGLRKRSKSYQMTVSEIKKVPHLGSGAGQLQFELKPDSFNLKDIEPLGSLKDIFEQGGL